MMIMARVSAFDGRMFAAGTPLPRPIFEIKNSAALSYGILDCYILQKNKAMYCFVQYAFIVGFIIVYCNLMFFF